MSGSVLIVGAGPVGLTLANLLGRRGHRVRVVERRDTPFDLPRAIHFDGEIMRVLQSTGLGHAILPHTTVGRGMLFKDATGRVLVDWSRDQAIGPQGWFESYRFHQPGLERVLRQGLDRFAGVSMQTGLACEALEQTAQRAIATFSDGTREAFDYVVGSDGARSGVRDAIGAGVEDLGFCEPWLVVDLVLRKPRPDLGDHTVQYCLGQQAATYVRGAGNRRRWEFRLHADDPAALEPARIWARLSPWLSPQEAEIERAAVYTFRSLIAQGWQKGRIFLAGDAAHQMPPFMGQGMCAGLRDVANLAWKLDFALQGRADVLDTYGTERAANVQAFIEQSIALGQLINQTVRDGVPKGQMKSIWPDLGPGLGPRDGVAGKLAPQPRLPDGRLVDDAAGQSFYVLANRPVQSDLPVFVAAHTWLADQDLDAVVVRPDGYVLCAGADPAVAGIGAF